MLGSATFAIVISISSVSMPKHTVSSVRHLRATANPGQDIDVCDRYRLGRDCCENPAPAGWGSP